MPNAFTSKYRPSSSTGPTLSGSTEAMELITMEELERRYIARVMDAVGWNKSEAAKVLGFDRSTLYRKLDRYGLGKRRASE
jgi:two-component system, NtrC family, response regulator AtoC